MQLKIKKEIKNETKAKCIRRLACRRCDTRVYPDSLIAVCMMTHKDIASKVLCDMFFHDVTVRGAAQIFDTRPAYFCHLKHEDRYTKVPSTVWAKLRKYCLSGKRLDEFKL